ncbi:MAG TPA: helix-turn-helix domain-containing protein [Candidatus Saccharibacteria bacterium]|nr:helix-turn-helix domain-containing protein [Candidatus Saccharibacteria bacterium]
MQTVGCLDQATQILGDKWTPRLLRFFINNESVRFCQLQELAGDINPRTLSARLVKLEKSGIITKQPLLGNRCEYELTAKGRDLLPILEHMNNWSEKYA